MYYSQQSYMSLLFRVAYTVDKFLSTAGDLADFFVCSYVLDEHIFYNFTYAFLKPCFIIRLIAFTQFHKFHLQLPVVFYFKYTFMDLCDKFTVKAVSGLGGAADYVSEEFFNVSIAVAVIRIRQNDYTALIVQ